MTSVIWSPQSIRDVESIRDFIARDSVVYAELVTRRIAAAVERLHTFPESGRIVPERNVPDIREVIVSPYRVVYRLREGLSKSSPCFAARETFRNPLRSDPTPDMGQGIPGDDPSRKSTGMD